MRGTISTISNTTISTTVTIFNIHNIHINVQVSSVPIPAGAHWTHSSTVWKDARQGDGDYPEIFFLLFDVI